MLNQLHIASLRPRVNARVLGSANYDETKANPYPDLPDPPVLKNGKKVTSAKRWRGSGGPKSLGISIVRYGRLPKSIPKIKWQVNNTVNENGGMSL
jgi:hypothetical protein